MERKKLTPEERAARKAREAELDARIQDLRDRADQITAWLEARQKSA